MRAGIRHPVHSVTIRTGGHGLALTPSHFVTQWTGHVDVIIFFLFLSVTNAFFFFLFVE